MKFTYLSAPDYISEYCEIADILLANYHNIYDYSTDTASDRETELFLDCCDIAETILYNIGIKKEDRYEQ